MIKESVAHVRPRAVAGAWARLLLVFVGRRRRMARRRRYVDGLSDHLLKDIGVSRGGPHDAGPGGIRLRPS